MRGDVIAVIGEGEPHAVTLVRGRRYIAAICECAEQLPQGKTENYAATVARSHRSLHGYKDLART